jgi:amidase
MDDLIRMTAREAVNRLANGEVSPLDLIALAERRIAATDDAINALPTRCFERARAKADALMKKRPDPVPPGYLHGLPVAIKDLAEVEGVRTTFGSPIYADHVPARSDLQVETLEAHGAIVIAKSNTPEFGAGAQTFNDVFGTTTNPWNTALTPGGSSGGAAAALAAGQVWLASGSDLGGSLRIPASFCGVVGLRPSPGRVAHGQTALPFDPLAVAGPMARTVGDVALMLDAMTGDTFEDPISLPPPPAPFMQAIERPVAPKRIAFHPTLNLSPVDPEVAEVCRRAAQSFSALGAEVVEETPDFGDAEAMFQTFRAVAFAARFQPLLENHRNKLKPEVIWNIEAGLKRTASEIAEAERGRTALWRRTLAFFEKFDLLLCPTTLVPPFDHRQRYLSELNGVTFPNYVSWLIPTFAVTLTACPAISVPCGFTATGLPIGLQMVARPRAEAALLSAAHLFEQAHDFHGLVPIDPRHD